MFAFTSSTGNSRVPFYTAALCSGCRYATIDSSGCHYGSYWCLGTIFWTWCPGSSTLIAVDHGEPQYLARTNTRGRFPALGGRHSRHCIGCPTIWLDFYRIFWLVSLVHRCRSLRQLSWLANQFCLHLLIT